MFIIRLVSLEYNYFIPTLTLASLHRVFTIFYIYHKIIDKTLTAIVLFRRSHYFSTMTNGMPLHKASKTASSRFRPINSP